MTIVAIFSTLIIGIINVTIFSIYIVGAAVKNKSGYTMSVTTIWGIIIIRIINIVIFGIHIVRMAAVSRDNTTSSLCNYTSPILSIFVGRQIQLIQYKNPLLNLNK